MKFNERLKYRRLELGLTLEDVGNIVGVSKTTVQRWESGEIENLRRDKIAKLSNALKTTPAYIMGWEDDKLKEPIIATETVTFPVIGEIAAGYNEIALEDFSGETVEIPTPYLKGRKQSDFFVLSIHGDSMYPLYMDGDKVLILRQTTLNRSGEIGAVLYDGDMATIKKVEYVQGEDWMKLIPINPEYQPKVIENSDLETCRVLGIPKLLIREINQ